MRKAIDTAPRNGDFVILEDGARGTIPVARWSAEAAQWLDEHGTPSQLNPTHWHSPQSRDEKGTPSRFNETYLHPLTPAQSVVKTADEVGSLTAPSKPSAWRTHRGASLPASGGMTAQPQRAARPGRSVNVWARFVGIAGRGCGKIMSAFAVAGGWIVHRLRSIVTMAACLLVAAAFAPFLYRSQPGIWLPHWTASENDTGLKQALRQEQERANKLARDVTAARREAAESQVALIREASEAADRDKEASERAIVGLCQALQLELAKAEKLAGQLVEAQRNGAAQAALTRKTIDDATRAEAERERVIGELRQAPLRLATEMSRVVDDGENLHVLPIVTRGPTENLNSLLYLRGVDLVIINTSLFSIRASRLRPARDPESSGPRRKEFGAQQRSEKTVTV